MKKTSRISRLLAMLLALAMIVNSQGMTAMAAVIGGVTGNKKQTEAPQMETEKAETQESEKADDVELESESESEGLTPAEQETMTEAAETELESETEAETEPESEAIVEEELTGVYTYEDEAHTMIVTATLTDPSAVPAGAVFVVEKKELTDEEKALVEEQLSEGVSSYSYAAYDMHFEYNGEEIELAEGSVSVSVEYKKAVELTTEEVDGAVVSETEAPAGAVKSGLIEFISDEELAALTAGTEALAETADETPEKDCKVLHLAETADEVKAEDVTDNVNVAADGKVEEVGFTTDSFSTVVYMEENDDGPEEPAFRISPKVTLDGKQMEAGEFSFVLQTGSQNAVKDWGGNAKQEVQNSEDGQISFAPINLNDGAGVTIADHNSNDHIHEFLLKQNTDSNVLAAYQLDKREYMVVAEVKLQRNSQNEITGRLTTVKCVLYKDQDGEEVPNYRNGASVDDVVFENSYKEVKWPEEDYTIEKFLNGYQMLVLGNEDKSGNLSSGIADLSIHCMGAVLVNGNLKAPSVSDGVNLPSSYVSGDFDSVYNGRNAEGENANDPLYIGSGNTVTVNDASQKTYDIKTPQGSTYTTGKGSTVYQCDNYLDFKKAKSAVKSAQTIMNSDSTDISTGGVITIQAGTTVEIPLSVLQSATEINIVGAQTTDANTIINVTGVEATDIVMPREHMDGAEPAVEEQHHEGTSVVWSFPDAKGKVTTPSQNWIGHIIAPDAKVWISGGNYNGTVICRELDADGEGHCYPYKGKGLTIPTEGDFLAIKTINNVAADAEFTFTMTQISAPDGAAEFGTDGVRTTTNKGEKVDFGVASYLVKGDYYYIIKETSGSSTNGKTYVYDTREYLVHVFVDSVTRPKPGDPSQTVTLLTKPVISYYEIVKQEEDSKKINVAGKDYYVIPKDVVSFNNTTEKVEKGKLYIEKTVAINGRDTTSDLMDGPYTFEVLNEDKMSFNPPVTLTVTIKDGVATASDTSVELDAGTYYVRELLDKDSDIEVEPKANLVEVTVVAGRTVKVEGANVAKFRNNKDIPVDVQFKVRKTFTNGAQDKQFMVELKAVKDTTEMPSEGDNPLEVSADGSISSFGNITYTEAGDYYYEISEKKPETPEEGIVYDDTVYEVWVKITQNDDGTLTDAVKYHKRGAADGAWTAGSDWNDDIWMPVADAFAFNFTNEQLGKLSVTKAVAGTVPDDASDDVYTVTVTPKAGVDQTIDMSDVTATVTKDGEVVADAPEATVTEGSVTFTFRAGETVTLNNMPAGTYVVKEESGDFITEYSVTSGNANDGAAVSIAGDEKSVTVTNTYPADAKLSLKAIKELTDGTLQADKYSFKLTLVETDPENLGVQYGESVFPAGGITLKNGQGTADASEILFRDLAFSKAGTYTFKLAEVPDETDTKVKYDTAEYTVTVTVTRNDEKKTYEVSSVTAAKKDSTDSVAVVEKDGVYTINPEKTFVNREKKGSLSVTKVVEGDTQVDATYTVHVTNGELSAAQWQAILNDTANAGLKGGAHGLALLLNESSEAIGLTFSIKRTETVTIEKLPIGDYTVEEISDSTVVYEATYEVDASPVDDGTVTVKDNETVNVEITNTYPDKVGVSFGGQKTVNVEGGEDYPETTFTFELYNASVKDGEVTADGDPIATRQVTMPTEDGKDSFLFSFQDEELGAVLTYKNEVLERYYIVKEKAESVNGFTYDENEHVVKVVVAKVENSNDLQAKVYIDGAETTDMAFTGITEVNLANGLDFNNTYTYGDLEVEKEVVAATGINEAETYTILVEGPEDADLSGAMVAVAAKSAEFATPAKATLMAGRKNVIVLTLTGGQKAKITKLPLGSYHVVEAPSTADEDKDTYKASYSSTKGKVAANASGGMDVTLEKTNTSGGVKVTNTYPNNGDLSVTKKVYGSWAPEGVAYTVEITPAAGQDMSGAKVYKSGEEDELTEGVTKTGNKITVTLKNNETIVVKELAPGLYNVNELSGSGFSTQYAVDSDEPGNAATVEISNTKSGYVKVQNTYTNEGELEIAKTVTGNTAPEDSDEEPVWYDITVQSSAAGAFTGVTPAEGSEKYQNYQVIDDGAGVSFELRADGHVKFTNLPTGTYTVTEAGTGFTKTFDVTGGTTAGDSAVVTLGKGEGEVTSGSVTVNNRYPNETSMQLTGTKEVVGKDLEDGQYTFSITAGSGNPAGATLETASPITNTGSSIDFGSITFTKAGTYSFTVEEIASNDDQVNKDGIVYTVEVTVGEDADHDYEITEVKITSTKSGVSKTYAKNGEWPTNGTFALPEQEDGDKTASFINKGKTGTLKVSKKIVLGDVTLDESAEYEFKVTADPAVKWDRVTATAGDGDVTLKEFEEEGKNGVTFEITGEQTVTLNNLPVGNYTVEETSTGNYVASYTVTKDGATSENIVLNENDDVTVTVTNTYPESTDMSLKGTKAFVDGAEGTYRFTLTTEAKDGVAITGAGRVEAEDETKPAMLKLTKQNEKPDNVFTFDGITFSAADSYIFTVTEEALDDDDIVFDSTTYTVTVTVEKVGADYEITGAVITSDKEGADVVTYGTEEGMAELPEDNAFTLPEKTFTNRKKRGALEVTKIVAGDADVAAAHQTDVYTVAVTNETINWSDEQIKVSSDKDAVKSLADVSGTVDGAEKTIGKSFTIVNGETVTFAGLPIGDYTVTETSASGEVLYTATYFVKVDGEDNKDDASVVTVKDGKTATVEITNTYPDKVSVGFSGRKSMTVVGGDDGDYPSTTFTFELHAASLAEDGTFTAGNTLMEKSVTMPVPDGGTDSFTFDTNDEELKAVLTYLGEGTHYYIVKEKIESENGVTYDGTEYDITVEVTEADGKLQAQVTVADKDGEPTTFTGTAGNLFGGLDFTNTYTYGDLSVTKVVNGRAPADTEYTVTVSSEKNFAGAQVQVGTGDVKTLEGEEVENTDGIYSYTFTLKDKETAYFTKLPVGSYTVTETIGEENYVAAYKVEGTKGETDSTVILTPESTSGAVEITNTYTNAGELSIIKKLSGTWAPDDKEYTITVSGGPAGADLSSNEITVSGIEADKVTKNADSIVLVMTANALVTIQGLMPGNYTVEETDPEDGSSATYSVKVNGAVATDAEGEVTGRTGTATVEINNDNSTTVEVLNTYPEVGKLQIEKAVAGETAKYNTDTYAIEVSGTDTTGATVTGTLDDAKVANDGKKISFTMAAGATVTIDGLKYGDYTVTETSTGNYVATYTVNEGAASERPLTIPAKDSDPNTVTVTNTYPDELHLKLDGDKKLVGRDLTKDEFTFTLTEAAADDPKAILTGAEHGVLKTKNDADGLFSFGGITFREAGTYTFEIKEIIEGKEDPDVTYDKTVYTAAVKVVKDGTQYKVESVTVTAANEDGKGVTVGGTEFEKAGTEGNSWTVTLPKHMDEAEATFINKIRKGSLKVQKIGVDAYEDDVFTFHVTLGGEPYTGTARLDGPGVPAAMGMVTRVDDGVLKLKAGFSATIGGILYGTEYEVTEDTDDAYATVTPENYKGMIGADEPNITVTYTNTYRTNDVTFQPKVTKTVSGRPAPKAGETYTFDLKVTRRKGADGETEELRNWAESVTVDMSNASTAIGEFTKREFTKAARGYTYIYTITEVIPDDAKTVDGKKVKNGVTYDETVYVYEVTIEDDSEGHLSANVVAKKNGVVTGGTQTIVDDGEATAAFVNTYKEEGSVQFKGTKALTGGKALEDNMFEFRIQGPDINTTVKNQGNEITFPKIEYTEPGTYTYTITEVNGGKKIDGITYDSDTYEVTVTVARSGNGRFDITVSGATKVGETDVYTIDVHMIEAAEDGSTAAKAATFVNEYSATGKASIETTKELTGRDLSKGEFTFVLKESDEEWTTDGEILARASNGAGVPDEESGASKGTVSFTDFKTYTLDDLGGATEKTFYYVILEDTEGKTDVEDGGITYDRDTVHVKVNVSDNGKGTLNAAAVIVDDKQGFINTYTANGSFKLNGNKELTGKRGEDVKAGEFNFVITDEDGKTVATGTTLAGGAIDFETIHYALDDVGTHVYTVSEVIPKEGDENFDPTITYRTQSFEVKVLVLDRGNGTLVVSPSYMKGSMEFVNDYNATGSVPASGLKKVNGKAVTPEQIERLNKLVRFQLWRVDDTGYVRLGSKSLEPDGTFKFTDLAYTQADIGNTYTYQMKEFQIADNDEMGGYTVDNTVYVFRVKVEDGEKHDGNLKLTLVDAEGNAIEGEPKLEAEFDNELTVEFHVNKTEVGDNSKEVEGAELEVLDKDGNVIDSWTSKAGETHDFGDKLEEGKSYVLRETVAPDGYAYTTDIEFSVTDNGEIETGMPKTTGENGETVYLVEDAPLHFNVNKTDVTNDEELEGAQLEVLDKDGKVVDSWTSKKGETHDFGAKLKAGESYTLREEVAPDGYAYVTDIEFTVEKDGTITTGMRKTTDEDGNETYLVEDAPLHFNVNKTDVTNDEELEGAQLEVLDKDGKVVDSWTSKKGETHDFGAKLKAGESYTLREEVAPDGYAYVTDIEFTVEKDGTITTGMRKTTDEDGNETYLVEDAPIIGSVILRKTNEENGEALAGAAFQLYYKTDETESGWALYNNAAYVTGIDGTLTIGGLTANDYYFVETEAPEGFVIATDEDGKPKQYPFTIGPDEADRTKAEVSVTLDVTNAPEEEDTKLVVTKQLVYDNELWNAVDATFYVALFDDEALTNRVSEVQAIEFKDRNTSSTTFENLEVGKTYYVAETLEDGTVVNDIGGVLATGEMYTADFYNDNVVTVEKGDGTTVLYFRNVFTEIPEEFYREGRLTITKQLLGADGVLKASNKTFYAGIFADAELTKLSEDVSQNIVKLALEGKSSVSDIVTVTVPEDGETTVYVTEVDKNGYPVAGSASFRYDVSVDGTAVTMDVDHLEGKVVITNQEREKETETEGYQEDETDTVPEKTKAVKTGDETPIALYIGLLLAAAVLLIAAILLKRRKKKN